MTSILSLIATGLSIPDTHTMRFAKAKHGLTGMLVTGVLAEQVLHIVDEEYQPLALVENRRFLIGGY